MVGPPVVVGPLVVVDVGPPVVVGALVVVEVGQQVVVGALVVDAVVIEEAVCEHAEEAKYLVDIDGGLGVNKQSFSERISHPKKVTPSK